GRAQRVLCARGSGGACAADFVAVCWTRVMVLRGYQAPWLIIGKPDEVPLREGAVVFDAEGFVLAVGSVQAVQARYPSLPLAREQGILLPGLVNVYVYLELSALRGLTQSGGGF